MAIVIGFIGSLALLFVGFLTDIIVFPGTSNYYEFDDAKVEIVCPGNTQIKQTKYFNLKESVYRIELQCSTSPTVNINKSKPKEDFTLNFNK